jgi:hypothetical protein
MVEGLNLTSAPFVQNRPIDGLDARKAPVAVAKQIREAILRGTYEPGPLLTGAQEGLEIAVLHLASSVSLILAPQEHPFSLKSGVPHVSANGSP